MPSINFEQTNPFSSNIKDIILASSDDIENGASIIDKSNGLCQFEKIEFVESVFDILPSGVVIVRDTSDIISYVKDKDILIIAYTNDSQEYYSIIGSSYLNNAASETEENFVAINFTNFLYKHSQTHSVTELMKTKSPQVYWLDDFVDELVANVSKDLEDNLNSVGDGLSEKIILPFVVSNLIAEGKEHVVSNFVHYKPLNTLKNIIDVPNDNYLQYINYISTMACEKTSNQARFLFWTDFANGFNFKFIYEYPEDPESDKLATAKMEENVYYYSVYSGDSPVQLLSDGKIYKKIYTMSTSPADEFISKKYFYVRKTPKLLNKRITTNPYKELSYQFQDDGDKYDIEYISSDGIASTVNGLTAGSEEMVYEGTWGYYGGIPKDTLETSSLMTGEYGNANQYLQKKLFGATGYFPFVDSEEMWKNMYDFTPLSPWYPEATEDHLEENGSDTYLQKVMDIRYDTLKGNTGGESDILKRSRLIENYNLVAYVLCCNKGMEEDTFYAILTGYTPETRTDSHPYLGNTEAGSPSAWLYRWCKIKYDAQYEDQNDDLTYAFNQIEHWKLDESEKSTDSDLKTWAINLNERRNLGSGDNSYLGPGWFQNNNDTSTKFLYRPIGMGAKIDFKTNITKFKEFKGSASTWLNGEWASIALSSQGNYYNGQIVRITKTPAAKLLMEAGITEQLIWDEYANKYLYTFDAQNIVDGPCN
jgi:hypothetical protein